MISDIGNLRSQFDGESVNLPLPDATILDRSGRPIYPLEECEPTREVICFRGSLSHSGDE
jgi:hypothetical protein